MGPRVVTKKRTRRRASTPPTRAADSPDTVKVIDEPIGQLPQFPPGIRFCPHDLELIEHYLMRKIRGKELPCDIVKSVDLYKFHPETLIENYKCIGETAWYFFTQMPYKYAKGVSRSANRGYWKVTGSNVLIWNNKEEAVGEKRLLTYFEGKQPNGTKTIWRMHEYTILEDHQTINQQKLYESWVLCKVYTTDYGKSMMLRVNKNYGKSMPLCVAANDCGKSMSLCVAAAESDVELTKDNIWEPDMPSKSQAEVGISLQERNNNDQQCLQVMNHPIVPKQSTLISRKYIWEPDMPFKSQAEVGFSLQERNNNDQQCLQVTHHSIVPKQSTLIPRKYIWEPDMSSKSQAEVGISLQERNNNDQQCLQVTHHPIVPKQSTLIPRKYIWEPDMPSKSQAEAGISLQERNNDQQCLQVTHPPIVPKQSTPIPRKYQINGGFPTASNQHGIINGGTTLPALLLNSQPRNFLPVLPQAYEAPSNRKSLGGVRQYHYHFVLCNCIQGSVISQESTHGSGSQMVNEFGSSNQSYMGQHVETYPMSESTTEPAGVNVYCSHMAAQPRSINDSDQSYFGSVIGSIGGGSSDLSEEHGWKDIPIGPSSRS